MWFYQTFFLQSKFNKKLSFSNLYRTKLGFVQHLKVLMWRSTSSRTDAGSTKRLIRQIHFRFFSWHCQYRFLFKKLSKSVILHILVFVLSLFLSIAYNKSRLKIFIKMYWINQDEEYVVGTFMTGFQLWCISKLETSNDHGCKTLKLPSGSISIQSQKDFFFLENAQPRIH